MRDVVISASLAVEFRVYLIDMLAWAKGGARVLTGRHLIIFGRFPSIGCRNLLSFDIDRCHSCHLRPSLLPSRASPSTSKFNLGKDLFLHLNLLHVATRLHTDIHYWPPAADIGWIRIDVSIASSDISRHKSSALGSPST